MAAESGEEGSQNNLSKRECCLNWYYEETKFLVQIWAGEKNLTSVICHGQKAKYLGQYFPKT